MKGKRNVGDRYAPGDVLRPTWSGMPVYQDGWADGDPKRVAFFATGAELFLLVSSDASSGYYLHVLWFGRLFWVSLTDVFKTRWP